MTTSGLPFDANAWANSDSSWAGDVSTGLLPVRRRFSRRAEGTDVVSGPGSTVDSGGGKGGILSVGEVERR